MRGPPNLRFLQMTPSLLHSAMPPLRPRDISAVSLSCLAAEGTMLSLLGRGARRLPSVRTSDCFPATLQSRLFGTSDLNVYGYDDLFPRQYLRQVDGARVCKGNAQQQPSTAGALLRWAILSGKRGELSLPLKATEVLEGLKRATARRLQLWAPPLSLSLHGASSLIFSGFCQPAPLPRCQEHSNGYGDVAEELGEDSAGGLFEGGLWATSVRRKRVTKMRKHKWRKRRKLQRQSASRRVK